MKILFVDFDGVICTARAALALKKPTVLIPPRDNIDPLAVSLINRICWETGAKIVLSTSWRSDSRLRAYLELIGFDFEHLFSSDIPPQYKELDVKNRWSEIWRTPYLSGVGRGEEIKLWLETYSFLNIEKYAILDDDDDFLDEQRPFLVSCDSAEGISSRGCWKAIDILRSNYARQDAHRIVYQFVTGYGYIQK